MRAAQNQWEHEVIVQQRSLAAEDSAVRSARAEVDAAMRQVKADRSQLDRDANRLASDEMRWRAEVADESARLAAQEQSLQEDRDRFRGELTAVQSTVEGREAAVQVRYGCCLRGVFRKASWVKACYGVCPSLITAAVRVGTSPQAQISKATAELQSAEKKLTDDRAALRRAAKELESRQARMAEVEAGLRARTAVLESREAEARGVKEQVRWRFPDHRLRA